LTSLDAVLFIYKQRLGQTGFG